MAQPNLDEIKEILTRFPYGAKAAQVASLLYVTTQEAEARLEMMKIAGMVEQRDGTSEEARSLWFIKATPAAA